MKKRTWTTIVAAGMTAVLMAGCGAGEAEAPEEPATETEAGPAQETVTDTAEKTEAAEVAEAETPAADDEYRAAAQAFDVKSVYTPEDHEMTTNVEGCYTFTDIVNKMEDGKGYTNVRIGDADVLMVAGGTYQWEKDVYGAIDAEIFCCSDSSDVPKYVGYVQAGGTAYPLTLKDDCLYVGGNHFMIRYTIENEEIKALEEAYVTYDTDGNATYFCRTDGKTFADFTAQEAEARLEALYEDLAGGEVIGFDTIGGVAAATELPKYEYPDDDPLCNAITEYLIDDIASNYTPGDVSIPQISEIAVDDTNPDDTLVWGDFWVFNYDLEDDLLLTVSGGAHPGLMHLAKKSDGTYVVNQFDPVADGSDYLPSAKEIFGDKYEDFAKVSADDKTRETFRKNLIIEYVESNGLEIRGYQDYGWDPVLFE